MFQFKLHPHTGEIRMEIRVYGKGGVIKKKLSFLICEKMDLVTMWNRVQYFTTDCSTSCMSILLSATRFGISLWHYSLRSYKMCYSTSSHIWTFVTPWPPWRLRSPEEIAARWRYRPPIKNMTAHYNSHCCFLQEAQKRLWMCLNGSEK